MKPLVNDLWNDLRARRLWPLAVVLVVAMVAAPVVLSKKSEAPAVPPAAPVASKAEAEQPKGPAALAQVKLDELASGSGSSLSSFEPGNPFAPPAKVLERARQEAAGTSAGAASEVPGGATGGGTTDPGSTGGDTGGTGDTGDDGDQGDDGDKGDTGDGGDTKTVEYTYVIDVTFTANGRTRRIDGMQKLDILPSQASPLLIYMGVGENAGNAVFLVDAELQTVGEGTCKPSASECAFLYLGAGSEQEFTTAEGDSYTLRVDQIRKVKAGADGSPSKKQDRSANAAVGAPPAPRRFVVPTLTDLVRVSTDEDVHSNSDRDRR